MRSIPYGPECSENWSISIKGTCERPRTSLKSVSPRTSGTPEGVEACNASPSPSPYRGASEDGLSLLFRNSSEMLYRRDDDVPGRFSESLGQFPHRVYEILRQDESIILRGIVGHWSRPRSRVPFAITASAGVRSGFLSPFGHLCLSGLGGLPRLRKPFPL